MDQIKECSILPNFVPERMEPKRIRVKVLAFIILLIFVLLVYKDVISLFDGMVEGISEFMHFRERPARSDGSLIHFCFILVMIVMAIKAFLTGNKTFGFVLLGITIILGNTLSFNDIFLHHSAELKPFVYIALAIAVMGVSRMISWSKK